MATVKTSNEPETIAAEPNGAVPQSASEVVKLDITEPTFMATAYDTYDALREKGQPVAYLTFEGEQHGFRRADSIIRSLEAELAFYGAVFGFTPAGSLAPVPIENAHRLPVRPTM